MASKVITVGTVCKDDPTGLAATLASVVRQKSQGLPVEWIVADGGSKEPTLSFIRGNAQHIDKILWGPDGGLYHGMNRIIDAAEGNSIIFMNAGDEFSASFDLSRIIQHPNFGENVFIGYTAEIFEDDCYIRPRPGNDGELIKYPHQQSMIIPLSICRNERFNPIYPFSADVDWIDRVIARSPPIVTPQIISIFRLGGRSNAWSFAATLGFIKERPSVKRAVASLAKLLLRTVVGQRNLYRLLYSRKYLHVPLRDMSTAMGEISHL